jgi:F-type H+-transporting ATPase subunit a
MSDAADIISHVKDSTSFHLPGGRVIDIPQPPQWVDDLVGFDVRFTKFMVIELIVAVLMIIIFVTLARRISKGGPPKGLFWNFFETMLVFMRDQVARPAIGKHDADRFLPYIWTIFFFVLFCNLMGMLPWMGSPTGALGCTGSLAIVAYAICVGAGVKRFGPLGYIFGQVPSMELPLALAIFLKPMILVIELFSDLWREFLCMLPHRAKGLNCYSADIRIFVI